MDDAPEQQDEPLAEQPSEQDRVMAQVDAALAPAHRTAQDFGPVNHSTLGAVLQHIRQALAHLVYGVQDTEPTGESLDMLGEQRKVQRSTETVEFPPPPVVEAPVDDDLDIPPAPAAEQSPFSDGG